MSISKLGQIDSVHRYPVKSLGGERLEAAFVSYSGLLGDRLYAFSRTHDGKVLSARQAPMLVTYSAHLTAGDVDVEHPNLQGAKVRVTDPDGRDWCVADHKLHDQMLEMKVATHELRYSERPMCDSRPVSLVGLNTIDYFSAQLDLLVDPKRLRANLYVRWTDPEPLYEDSIVGQHLQIGEKLTIQVSKKDPRCSILATDPYSGKVDPAILKRLVQLNEGNLGVYGVVLREGVVRPGDAVHRVS